MKTVFRSRRGHHMARVGIPSIMVALVAGMAGCASSATEYDLTISSTDGGAVTTPGEGIFIYDDGDVVDLAATPDARSTGQVIWTPLRMSTMPQPASPWTTTIPQQPISH